MSNDNMTINGMQVKAAVAGKWQVGKSYPVCKRVGVTTDRTLGGIMTCEERNGTLGHLEPGDLLEFVGRCNGHPIFRMASGELVRSHINHLEANTKYNVQKALGAETREEKMARLQRELDALKG